MLSTLPECNYIWLFNYEPTSAELGYFPSINPTASGEIHSFVHVEAQVESEVEAEGESQNVISWHLVHADKWNAPDREPIWMEQILPVEHGISATVSHFETKEPQVRLEFIPELVRVGKRDRVPEKFINTNAVFETTVHHSNDLILN